MPFSDDILAKLQTAFLHIATQPLTPEQARTCAVNIAKFLRMAGARRRPQPPPKNELPLKSQLQPKCNKGATDE